MGLLSLKADEDLQQDLTLWPASKCLPSGFSRSLYYRRISTMLLKRTGRQVPTKMWQEFSQGVWVPSLGTRGCTDSTEGRARRTPMPFPPLHTPGWGNPKAFRELHDNLLKKENSILRVNYEINLFINLQRIWVHYVIFQVFFFLLLCLSQFYALWSPKLPSCFHVTYDLCPS